MEKILIVIDMQKDFITGALGFPQARAIVPKVEKRIKQAIAEDELIIFTSDDHCNIDCSYDYLNSREGKHLPILHCVDEDGCEIVFNHLLNDNSLVSGGIIKKHTFGAADLLNVLACENSENVLIDICGVVTNLCVLSNAVIAQTACPNAEIRILADLCAAPSIEDHERALKVMEDLHMEIVYE